MSVHFPFDNSYARLPSSFYARVAPSPVSAPRLVALNRALAEELGIEPEALASPEGVEILAGRRVPEGADPLAMAYAGHQFGQFVPQLGDGRAILLGEVVDRNGRRRDIQLKGSGRTPFSRGGDGRAALGPVMREFLVSEAMAALGIPTTRSLAAVMTGDRVLRDDILPGAVLTRVAESHVRVGTFQYFAVRGDLEGLRRLTGYVIARNHAHVAGEPPSTRALLDSVVERQAALVGRWMLVGFIHGVMNTDNMSISGETIDYGPCAFMEAYDPGTVFSSIDRQGRYAYANQPSIAQWNLARLAECLIPLMGEEAAPEATQEARQEAGLAQAREALGRFGDLFNAGFQEGLRQKLGMAVSEEGDVDLAQDLLDMMAASGADFTATFRRLATFAEGRRDDGLRAEFIDLEAFDGWLARWLSRIAGEAAGGQGAATLMRRVNPLFIARNHRVEEAIAAATERDDLGPFERLRAVLSRPFDEQPGAEDLTEPSPDRSRDYVTFCGT